MGTAMEVNRPKTSFLDTDIQSSEISFTKNETFEKRSAYQDRDLFFWLINGFG
jgi:hypothetical protein